MVNKITCDKGQQVLFPPGQSAFEFSNGNFGKGSDLESEFKPTLGKPKDERKDSATISEAVNKAKKILQSGKFATTSSDIGKRKIDGFTISQAQGTKGLREGARRGTKNCLMALSSAVLRLAEDSNKINSLILRIKRLGHALNLKGDPIKLIDKDGTTFEYEGFSEAFTLPMVASSVKQYAQQTNALILEEDANFIAETLNSSYSDDIFIKGMGKEISDRIRNPENHEVFSISSGYDWHGTHIFFFRGFLIYCNRGFGNKKSPGIFVYKVPKRNLITPKIIDGLIQRHRINREQWEKDFERSSLEKTLGLESVCHIKQKVQKRGYCTYISTKCGVKALLAIKYLMKNFEDNPIPDEKWEEAFSETKEAYKRWNYYDKNLVIEDLLKDVKYLNEESTIISKEQIKKIFDDVGKKINLKPERYKEVLSLLVESIPLLTSVSLSDKVFDKEEWERYIGDIGEEPPLPGNILEILNKPCPFWPLKRVYQTHTLLLIPKTVNGKPLTLKYFGELVASLKKGNRTFDSDVLQQYGDKPIGKSIWVLVTNDLLPGSTNKTFKQQQELVAKLSKEANVKYEVVEALDAVVLNLTTFVSSGELLYSNEPTAFTHCQERTHGKQLVVGSDCLEGLLVSMDNPESKSDILGVAARRKLLVPSS